jgi:protein-disulfide isomerase
LKPSRQVDKVAPVARPVSGARGGERPEAISSARLPRIGALVASAGVVLSGLILYVHARLATDAGGYTSFCNVNARVNCDQVLTSTHASVFGLPVAAFAFVGYAAIATLLWMSTRPPVARAGRALGMGLALIGGSTAVTLYFAAVAAFLLRTVCLLCGGLYLVSLALAGIALAIARRPGSRAFSGLRWLGAGFTAAAALVGAMATAGQFAEPAERTCRAVTVAEVPAAFRAWYEAQPRVRQEPVDPHRHRFGNPEASVTIVEYLDFECTYCRSNHEQLTDLLARHRDDLRVIYRHFPLDASCNERVEATIHPRACRAAEAAECAAAQGRFAEMADAMFARQTQLFESNLSRIAEREGLDMEAFTRCMSDHEMLPRVLDDCRAGREAQLTSTPTLFINDRKIVGSIKEPCGYDYAIAIERATQTAR